MKFLWSLLVLLFIAVPVGAQEKHPDSPFSSGQDVQTSLVCNSVETLVALFDAKTMPQKERIRNYAIENKLCIPVPQMVVLTLDKLFKADRGYNALGAYEPYEIWSVQMEEGVTNTFYTGFIRTDLRNKTGIEA